MRLMVESERQRAYDSRFEISGVVFKVVSQIKQGFLDARFWTYEVEVVEQSYRSV